VGMRRVRSRSAISGPPRINSVSRKVGQVMYQSQALASFVVETDYEDLTPEVRGQLKIRILDSLGCAIGALEGPPIRALREQLEDFDGSGRCSLIGGGSAPPDRAALYNSALVRYLDFNDSYLAEGETCHPSDNLGSVLAALEYRGASGKDLLTALGIAYQVQCRLSDEAPVRAKGFDHTTQGSFAVAAGVSKALSLDPERTTNAIAISGTAFNALRVTRTGPLSNWKGLAYPNTGFCATHATFLAMRGITGAVDVFEGNKGFMESISGPFTLDWKKEGIDRVNRTILKKFNAEIHSQSSLEGLLELREQEGFTGEDIESIHLDTFDVAFNIIGGGEEGSKVEVFTKEAADHSLPYMLAVAALDDQVMPEQYAPERIMREDVQNLLRRVEVEPSPEYSARFPEEMPCTVKVRLKDGRELQISKRDYAGFFTRPMSWEQAVDKFSIVSAPYATEQMQRDVVLAVEQIEDLYIDEFMRLLRYVGARPEQD
jgi:2-methylcitrate dehydratase